jgi:hypothetical protein
MYIIDYKQKTIAKFSKKELSNFLNYSYDKKRFIFVDNKQHAKQVIKYAMRLTNWRGKQWTIKMMLKNIIQLLK